MNKIITTLLLVSGIPGLLFWSCCPEENLHWQPESIDEINAYYNGMPVSDSTQVDSIDAFWFEVLFDVVYAQSTPENGSSFSTFFTPTLSATRKCPSPGSQGLMVPLQDIIVTCDQPYQDVDAGERLDEKLIINNDTLQTTGISPVLEKINQGNEFAPVQSFHFQFTQKPDIENYKIFTIQFVFQNGELLEGQTPEVWM